MATGDCSFYDEHLKKQIWGTFKTDGKALYVLSEYGTKRASYNDLGPCIDHNSQVSLISPPRAARCPQPQEPACAGIASASIGRLRSRQAIQTVQSAFVRQALRFLRLLFRRSLFCGLLSKGASSPISNGASFLTSLRWAKLSLAKIRSARLVRSIKTSRRSLGFCRRSTKLFLMSRSISSTALLCRMPRRSAKMPMVTCPPGVPLMASSA